MEKEGISHIEVILAFILFISFLFFAWYFFNPFHNTRLLDSSLSYATTSIVDNASVTLTTYAVKINESSTDSYIMINISGIPENMNVDVRNDSWDSIQSSRSGDDISILNAEIEGQSFKSGNAKIKDGDLLYIRFSEDFPAVDSFTGTWIKHEIASVTNERVISEKRILALNRSYYLDLSDLKESFNLPSRIDFGFGLIFSENDKITADTTVSKGLEVFSNSKRVEVLRIDGKMQFADLMVRVW